VKGYFLWSFMVIRVGGRLCPPFRIVQWTRDPEEDAEAFGALLLRGDAAEPRSLREATLPGGSRKLPNGLREGGRARQFKAMESTGCQADADPIWLWHG